MKQLWTNKALAEIKVFRFEDAVTSASKVLELCEIFEDGYEKSKDLAFKALYFLFCDSFSRLFLLSFVFATPLVHVVQCVGFGT